MKIYMEFIEKKVGTMLEANAFVYWYGTRKCKEKTKSGKVNEVFIFEYKIWTRFFFK